jgi:hypothetical protein
MEISSKIDGAFVTKWEALEHEDIDTPTEYRILCTRQSAQQLVAQPEDNQGFILGTGLTNC